MLVVVDNDKCIIATREKSPRLVWRAFAVISRVLYCPAKDIAQLIVYKYWPIDPTERNNDILDKCVSLKPNPFGNILSI